MERALPFCEAFVDTEVVEIQDSFDRLGQGKISWEKFRQKNPDLAHFSRLVTKTQARSLLHLAILDNELDVVRSLCKDPFLKQRRDVYGLSPIELAQFLDRKEALTMLGFASTSHLTFETKEALEKILQITAKAKKEDEIPAEKIWMGIYYDKEISRGLHPPVAVRFIDEEIGQGVFAEKKIAPCSFVGEYTGLVLESSPKKLFGKKYCLRYTLWEGKKNFAIDAEKTGNFTRFINHSSRPNLGLQSVYWRGIPRMIFVALTEIGENAQLTFDYGQLYWKEFKQIPRDL